VTHGAVAGSLVHPQPPVPLLPLQPQPLQPLSSAGSDEGFPQPLARSTAIPTPHQEGFLSPAASFRQLQQLNPRAKEPDYKHEDGSWHMASLIEELEEEKAASTKKKASLVEAKSLVEALLPVPTNVPAETGACGRDFISSRGFTGIRDGYVFKHGSLGIGYYRVWKGGSAQVAAQAEKAVAGKAAAEKAVAERDALRSAAAQAGMRIRECRCPVTDCNRILSGQGLIGHLKDTRSHAHARWRADNPVLFAALAKHYDRNFPNLLATWPNAVQQEVARLIGEAEAVLADCCWPYQKEINETMQQTMVLGS